MELFKCSVNILIIQNVHNYKSFCGKIHTGLRMRENIVKNLILENAL